MSDERWLLNNSPNCSANYRVPGEKIIRRNFRRISVLSQKHLAENFGQVFQYSKKFCLNYILSALLPFCVSIITIKEIPMVGRLFNDLAYDHIMKQLENAVIED